MPARRFPSTYCCSARSIRATRSGASPAFDAAAVRGAGACAVSAVDNPTRQAFVLEMVFLTFALGDRIRILKAMRDRALQRIIQQHEVNMQLKDKVNRELEQKVTERTLELNEKNHQLEQSNILLERHVIVVAKHGRGDNGLYLLGITREQIVDDPIVIDRHTQCLAHFHFVEGWLGNVHAQVEQAQVGAFDAGRIAAEGR